MTALIKQAAQVLTVAEIVYYRCTIGFLLILPVALGFVLGGSRHKLQTLKPRQPKMVILRAVFNLAAMGAGFYAVANIQLGTAAILSSTKVFFLVPLSAIFLSERTSRSHWLFNMVAFLGAVLILYPPGGIAPIAFIAGICALVGAFFVAAGIVTLRTLGRVREHPVIVLFWVATLTAIAVQVIIPLDNFLGSGSFELSTLLLVLAITLLGLGGQFCNVLSYRHAAVPSVAVFSFLRLVLALLYGFWLFGEVPDLWALVGMVLIILSAAAAAKHSLKKSPIKRGLQIELRDAT